LQRRDRQCAGATRFDIRPRSLAVRTLEPAAFQMKPERVGSKRFGHRPTASCFHAVELVASIKELVMAFEIGLNCGSEE